MSLEHISVEILDKKFTIGSPEEERPTLLQAVDLLNKKIAAIQSMGRQMDTEKIVVMASLNLTHDLLKIVRDNQKNLLADDSIQRKIDELDKLCNQYIN